MAGSIFPSPLRSAALSAALVALLGACSQDRDLADTGAGAPAAGAIAPAAGAPGATAQSPTGPTMGEAAICNGEGVQALVGQEATETVVAQATADSGATSVRVLGPDDMATMDFRADRLTITTDANRVIQTLVCG